jgi:MFS family permease
MATGDSRIRSFYVFRALTSFSLWLPFWTLWVYQNLAHHVFLVTVVDSAFWITMIFFQIPAGLIGDRYGRRVVLFVGEALYAVGVLAFGLSTEFAGYLFSNIVWALGVCFIVSGDTPFVYDTLLELRKPEKFMRVMGNATAIMLFMNAIACVIGGIIVQETNRKDLTLIIASVIGLIGSFTALALKEPKVDRREIGSYRAQLRAGIKRVFFSRPVLILILFQILIQVAVYVMAVFRSIYMSTVLMLNFLEIGIFFASFSIVGGILTREASRIEGWLGEKRSLSVMFAMVFFSFIVVFIVKSPVAIVMQYLIYAVSDMQGPIIGGYINKRVESLHRSTVMAIASMIFTGVLTVVEIGSGKIADIWGLQTSLLVLAIGIAPVGILLMLLWNKEVDQAEADRKVHLTRVLKEPS